jgi:hypothetical protein
VTKQVEMGRLGSAAHNLGGKSAVATVTEVVVEALRAKHPTGPPSPFGTAPGPRNGEIPPEDTLLDAFKSIDHDRRSDSLLIRRLYLGLLRARARARCFEP